MQDCIIFRIHCFNIKQFTRVKSIYFMAESVCKTYRIVKEKQNRQSLKACRKFKIRPPIFQMPTINIHAHFTRFKVEVKAIKFQPFGSKSKDRSNVKQNLDCIKLESDPQSLEKSSKNGSAKKIDDIQFLRNRNSILFIDKINLVDLSIDKVISYFFSEGLMLNEYYSRYTKDRESNKSSKKQLFMPIDHRIFSQLLVKYFGNNYAIEKAKKDQKQTDQLYQISLEQYLRNWDQFNKNNSRSWLPKGQDLLNDPDFFRKQHKI